MQESNLRLQFWRLLCYRNTYPVYGPPSWFCPRVSRSSGGRTTNCSNSGKWWSTRDLNPAIFSVQGRRPPLAVSCPIFLSITKKPKGVSPLGFRFLLLPAAPGELCYCSYICPLPSLIRADQPIYLGDGYVSVFKCWSVPLKLSMTSLQDT